MSFKNVVKGFRISSPNLSLLYTPYVVSGFLREADDICAILGYYVAYGGNSLTTFREKLSVLEVGPIGCPETSVRNYQPTLRNIPEERRSYICYFGIFRLFVISPDNKNVCEGI